MSICLRPSYGNTKPPLGTQINRDHHLARNLRGAYIFNEGAGEHCYNSQGGLDDTGTVVGANVFSSQNYVSFDGSTQYFDCGRPIGLQFAHDAEWWGAARIRAISTGIAEPIAYSNNGSGGGWYMGWDTTTTVSGVGLANVWFVDYYDGTNFRRAYTPASSLKLNTWQTVFWIQDGPNNVNYIAVDEGGYLHQGGQGGTLGPPSTFDYSTANLEFGSRKFISPAQFYSGCDIDWVYFFSGFTTFADQQLLLEKPFDIFQQPRGIAWFLPQASTGIDPQTGSGGIVLGSATGNTITLPYTASGGLVFGGSSPASQATASYTVTASGGLVLGDAAILLPTYIYQPTGNIVFGGFTSATSTFAYAATGNIVFGGSASVASMFFHTASGNAVFGGSTSATSTFTYTATTGNIVLGGNALIQNMFTASGGVVFSNSTIAVAVFAYLASGNIVLGGDTLAQNIFTASGGMVLFSDSAIAIAFAYTASGNIVSGNTAPTTASFTYAATGGLVSGNSSIIVLVYTFSVTGNVAINGIAGKQFACSYTVTAGNIVADGTAMLSYSYIASGGIVAAGSIIVNVQAFIFVASGNITTFGLFTVNPLFVFIASGGSILDGTSFGYTVFGFDLIVLSGSAVVFPTYIYATTNGLTITANTLTAMYLRTKLLLKIGTKIHVTTKITITVVSYVSHVNEVRYLMSDGVVYTLSQIENITTTYRKSLEKLATDMEKNLKRINREISDYSIM